MTTYKITYIRTGSRELDNVWINNGDEFEFESGIEIPRSITDAIEVFEMLAEKWWGTYENRHAITNIEVIER